MVALAVAVSTTASPLLDALNAAENVQSRVFRDENSAAIVAKSFGPMLWTLCGLMVAPAL